MVPPDAGSRGLRAGRPRLGGREVAPIPARSSPAVSKKRVLFVCIGNSCRSQMAEGFVRAYGVDVISPRSSGVSPATMIAPLTKQVLGERNIDISHNFPKAFDGTNREAFELVVNMTGGPLALRGAKVINWNVPDPIGQKEAIYREVASLIEALVMRLILDVRNGIL